MLEFLEVEQFQPHAKKRIEFDPHVTVIAGDNGRGKSALLRALQWVMLNAGRSEKFMRWGSDFTRATIGIDGHTIERFRGKTGNTYTLDGELLQAVGRTDAPEPVARLVNCGENNFQRQHGGHFWVFDSAGQVARSLNAVVDLEVIDTAQAKALADLTAAKKHHEAAVMAATAAAGALAALPDTTVAEADMVALRAAMDARAAAVARAAAAQTPADIATQQWAALDRMRAARADLATLLSALKDAHTMTQRANAAAGAAHAIEQANRVLARKSAGGDWKAVAEAHHRARQKVAVHMAAGAALAALEKARGVLVTLTTQRDTHAALMAGVEPIKPTPPATQGRVCPTCQRPM